jgi:hypothetical protein
MVDLLAPLAFAIPLLLFWMWMFSHMMRNASLAGETRGFWIFAFVFMNVFAAVLYFFNVYRRRG